MASRNFRLIEHSYEAEKGLEILKMWNLRLYL